MTAGNWTDFAACKGESLATFFPGPGGGNYARAKQICGQCPVRELCLQAQLKWERKRYPDASKEPSLLHGCFGGLTPPERARLMDSNAPAKTCELCGKPISNVYGVCQGTPECNTEYRKRSRKESDREKRRVYMQQYRERMKNATERA